MGNGVVIDCSCQSLAASIEADIDALPELSRYRCIYKVPKLIREVNKQAYTPIVVSIGPLHYKDASLFPMEVEKLKCLQSFLYDPQNKTNLNHCLRFVKYYEAQIRESYAEPTIHISSDEFNRMILVDSVFIIEFFRKCYHPSLIEDDHIFGKPRMINDVVRDMILVENQVPFFVLTGLYKIAFKPQESDSPCFTDLACTFLEIVKATNETCYKDLACTFIQIDRATNATTYCHLLDLLLSSYKPRDSIIRGGKKLKSVICPTATTLREAGVRFQVAKSSGSSLLYDINVEFDYNKGILIIPRLDVMDRTESFMRNLIAFEQFYRLSVGSTYISDYQRLLDCLINTPEDVQILIRAGIIVNWLGSEKHVSDLMNSLGDHVITFPLGYLYDGVTEQLNRYCDKRWNRYKASLKHTYFKHPWAIISVFYAVILLLFTLIQVVLAIMSLPSVSNKS